MLQAIADHNGNKTKAADSLGISRRSLHRKLQKYSDPT
ncbi:MAG: helix-turn-helix domain-containing protein [Anaerovoracaceae bacterium]